MGLFGFFRKKQTELTDEQKKWNTLWELWVEGNVEVPYRQLMTYQSDVSNGGHDQYFTNIENTGNLPEELSVLKTILPQKLSDNLQTAYRAYLVLENAYDEAASQTMQRCDSMFYEAEKEITRTLQEYAKRIKL